MRLLKIFLSGCGLCSYSLDNVHFTHFQYCLSFSQRDNFFDKSFFLNIAFKCITNKIGFISNITYFLGGILDKTKRFPITNELTFSGLQSSKHGDISHWSNELFNSLCVWL